MPSLDDDEDGMILDHRSSCSILEINMMIMYKINDIHVWLETNGTNINHR